MRREGPFQDRETAGVDERAFASRLFLLDTLRCSSPAGLQLRPMEWAFQEIVVWGFE